MSVKSIVPGPHHPERTSTLYPWSNPWSDWAIFRNVFPANFCLLCGPYMNEINAEKNGGQREVPHPSSVFLDHVDRSGDRRSRETAILKIAQAGHKLSLRLSMGDVRSGWWTPGSSHSKYEVERAQVWGQPLWSSRANDYLGRETSVSTGFY